MLPWIAELARLDGQHEIKGSEDNPVIVQLFADAGHSWVKDDETAWCAALVSAVLARCGLKSPKTLRALDYSRYGDALPQPTYGCIAVKLREGGGHVAFVVGWDQRYVWLWGGNQGDSVRVSRYLRSEIKWYRWPSDYPAPSEFPDVLPWTGHAIEGGKES